MRAGARMLLRMRSEIADLKKEATATALILRSLVP
jgi:hypothetical protein